MSLCKVDVCLLACAETAEYLVYLLVLDHLVQDDQSAWVKHLIDSGSVVLVLHSDAFVVNLILRRLQGVAHLRVELALKLVIHIIEIDLLVLLDQLLVLLCAQQSLLVLVELLEYLTFRLVFATIVRA